MWLGGDAAISVDLGAGRILWLFGDSFIALDSSSSRAKSAMVHNTIALQQGYDPVSASLLYYSGHSGSSPAPFFKESNDWYLWPRDGVRIGGSLLLLFARVRPAQGGLGFEEFGWTAAVVQNPDDAPAQWNISYTAAPTNYSNLATIPATLVKTPDFLYAYMAGSPNPHSVTLARWPLSDAAAGTLASPQWWTGNSSGWRTAGAAAQPIQAAQLFDAQTEFSVYYDSTARKYIEIQTDGFGSANLAYRMADSLQGPWPTMQDFYRPPEFGSPNIMMYSARVHPEQRAEQRAEQQAAGMVITYNVNSFDFATLVGNSNLYYPKVVIARVGR
jgi:hypothetical protein